MHEERTLAVVLRTRPHGESDKIVTFLTRDRGKVTGIAKGAKRSRRRFVNVLEPFTHVRLRFRPSRTDELAFILGCEMVRAFRRPSRDLHRFALASYVAELADVMVAGREAGAELYDLLLRGLGTLETRDEVPGLFRPAFELRLLAEVGYAPDLAECQACGTALDGPRNGAVLGFSPGSGGLLCPSCAARGSATLRLSCETLATLRTWLADASEPSEAPSPRVSREARALVSRLLTRHLSRPLKSLAFLEQTAEAPDEDGLAST